MAHFCWCQIKLWEAWLGLGGVAHLSIKGSETVIYILLNAFSTIVGRSHQSTWTLVEALQQLDQALATTDLAQGARGPKRLKRAYVKREERLPTICRQMRDGVKTFEETASSRTMHRLI